MPLQRTIPDGGVIPSEYLPADIDSAELAARIGSPDVYRREGRVISITDFSPNREGWVFTNCILSAARAYNGNASVLQNAPFGSASTMEKLLPINASLKMGLSCYSIIETHYTQYQFLKMRLASGSGDKSGFIRIDYDNAQLAYLNSSGVYTVFYTNTNLRSLLTWVNFKLTVDFENNLYLRFFWNNIDTMAGISPPALYNAAGVPGTGIICSVQAQSTIAAPSRVFVDSPIVTVHEF